MNFTYAYGITNAQVVYQVTQIEYGPEYNGGSLISYEFSFNESLTTPLALGTYSYTLEYTNGTYSGTISITDTVKPTITGPSTLSYQALFAFDETVLSNYSFSDNHTPNNQLDNYVTGTRNYNVAGTYNITINSKDLSGNIQTKSVTLTITPQNITISKKSNLTITTVNYPFLITASQLETLLKDRVNVFTGGQSYTWDISPTPVNWDAPFEEDGFFTKSYTIRVYDNYYNQYTSSVTIVATYQYVDNVAPTIIGPNTITLVEDTYFDEDVLSYFIITDNVTPDNELDNYVTGTRDYNTAGTYSIVINSKDAANNVGTKNVTLIITASTAPDTSPPIAFGPSSFTFILADNKRVSDVRSAYTVYDNRTPTNEIRYEATIGGSSVEPTYQFPLGITNLVLRFYDNVDNYTSPINIVVNVLATASGLKYGEDAEKLASLVEKQQYSATMVSRLVNDTWTPISWLTDPVQVNYTIDGLQDEININFLSQNINTRLLNGELIRVVYASTSAVRSTWGVPEYDAKDRPTNHDIMLVESGQMVKLGEQDYYRHNYKLVELINVLKDYRVPTLTYTSFDSSTIINASTGTPVTYYLKPYNALTILQRAIKQAFPIATGATNPLVDEIKIIDSGILENEMIGVDHQFQEATLYDVVTEIGRILNKTPVLYLNPEYSITNNEKYLLFFENDREHTNGIVQKADLLANSSEFIETTIPNKGAGQVVVDAHNIIGSSVTIYPSEDLFTYASAIDQELTTVGTNKQMCIVLPNKISAGEKVKYRTVTVRYNVNSDTIQSGYPVLGTVQEIPLMKYNDWLVLEFLYRQKTAYYKENENIVYLPVDNDKVFTSDGYSKRTIPATYDEFKYVLYQVEYFPIMDFEAKIGDGKQTTFNQINALADSETLGEQVYNYKDGNEGGDIAVSKVVLTYPEILKPTQLVNWDGDIYHIVSVSFNTIKLRVSNNMTTGYKVAYQLNRDIRRNANLNAPTNQREYQIPYDNVFERYDVIKEPVKFHFTTNVKASNAPIINDFKFLQLASGSIKYRYLLGGLETVNTYPTVETVVFGTQSVVFNNDSYSSTSIINDYIAAPLNKTLFGKSIMLNLKMPNNIYAGTKIVPTDIEAGERFQQRQVKYTDPFGRVQTISIKYLWQDLTTGADFIDITKYFPQYTQTKFNNVSNILAQISLWQIDKDSRETLNATLQLDYQGINGTLVGTGFTRYSGLYKSGVADSDKLRLVKLVNNTYKPDDRIGESDISGAIMLVDDVLPYYDNGYQIVLDDEYTLDTTSTYALVEVVGIVGINYVYKILTIMGDRTSLSVTDRVYIYY